MKKTLTLLFTIFSAFSLIQAQELVINVHVSDTASNPQVGVEVFVIDSLENTTTVQLTDSSGNAQFIFNPGSSSTGNLYFVFTADCNGNLLSEIVFYQGGDQQVDINFTWCADPVNIPCDVFIDPIIPGTPQGALVAIPSGVPPFSFAWSTGDSVQTIQAPGPGTYCVTATDAAGCTAEECIVVDSLPGDSSCWASIHATYDSSLGSWLLVASGNGTDPFQFEWNNGESGDSILVDSGTWCVTVTDNNGCESVACVSISVPFCDVFFSYSPSGLLLANPIGIPPFDYSWSTGDTTPDIQVGMDSAYCVTITDATGCVASNCFYPNNNGQDSLCWVDIVVRQNGGTQGYFLEAIPAGLPPFTFSWSTGETGPTIVAQDSGQYCVTVTDATGCVATACISTDQTGACGVQFLCDPPGSLTAWAYGAPPFTYEWNTGDSVETISTDPGNTYCVTVTDATGCEATACTFIDTTNNFPDSICWVFVDAFIDYANDSAELFAWSPSPFMDYFWSTGETGPFITVDSPGTYCVTGVDSNFNCSVTECITVDFTPDSTANNIGGFVLGDAAQFVDGDVILFREDSAGQWSAIDTTQVPTQINGAICHCYIFTDLAPGTYYTQVIPDDPDFMPTYHFSESLWTNADPIPVPNNGNMVFDILALSTSPLMGPGFIGGTILDGSNFDMGNSRNSDPMVGVSILLTDAANRPLNQVYSNAAGDFSFASLPWGIYRLHIDYPNVDPKMIEIELTPSNPVITNTLVTFDGDQFTTAVHEISGMEGLRAYPNPFTDLLVFEMEPNSNESRLLLRSADGRKVTTLQLPAGEGRAEFELSALPEGIYILEIENGNNVYFERLIKID